MLTINKQHYLKSIFNSKITFIMKEDLFRSQFFNPKASFLVLLFTLNSLLNQDYTSSLDLQINTKRQHN